MKTLTTEKLKELKAYSGGIEFVKSLNTECFKEIFEAGIKSERFCDLIWLVKRLMTKEQSVKYAIFAAEQVIDIFEDRYPEDKRPREAINAAKDYLNNPCEANRIAARDAADAADDAANEADAAYAAANAADDYAAANAAAACAAYATNDPANAASAAARAADDDNETFIKILRYGFGLIYGE